MTGVDGAWAIKTVQVNADSVSNREGFERLVVSSNRIAIEPAGIEFSVNQSTSRSAVLESRSQIFFAEYFTRNGELTLELSRPTFKEKIRLNAEK